ncbi:MAG: 4Fe-4S binding protein [Candidatus Omnitrophica bacterium]|nr:4Fe-4S binding protein [Candidatus Omnitrophota bacterium]
MKKLRIDETLYIKTPGFLSEQRIRKGPVAIIECTQDIPCNPCETICPRKAIKIGLPITNPPEIDEAKCSGCGLCVLWCPGLAIFVLNYNFDKIRASLTIPYEMLPLPGKNEKIKCLDRNGKYVCKGKIEKVTPPKKNSRTSLITFSFQKKYFNTVRGFKK